MRRWFGRHSVPFARPRGPAPLRCQRPLPARRPPQGVTGPHKVSVDSGAGEIVGARFGVQASVSRTDQGRDRGRGSGRPGGPELPAASGAGEKLGSMECENRGGPRSSRGVGAHTPASQRGGQTEGSAASPCQTPTGSEGRWAGVGDPGQDGASVWLGTHGPPPWPSFLRGHTARMGCGVQLRPLLHSGRPGRWGLPGLAALSPHASVRAPWACACLQGWKG